MAPEPCGKDCDKDIPFVTDHATQTLLSALWQITSFYMSWQSVDIIRTSLSDLFKVWELPIYDVVECSDFTSEKSEAQ